jgi:hypothetical protein
MDTNGDTGGSSVVKSEDVIPGDGYDKLLFDGGAVKMMTLTWHGCDWVMDLTQ